MLNSNDLFTDLRNDGKISFTILPLLPRSFIYAYKCLLWC